MALNICILAAGQGTRMRSRIPKVLHALAGTPLLGHVLATAASLRPDAICIVYGHGAEQVRTAFSDVAAEWALQEPQLGTGHALKQALPHLTVTGRTLVLYGDVPLLRAETLKELLAGDQKDVVLLTTVLADPAGYGRILRNTNSDIERIVEHKDASPAEREITEVNTGVMVLPSSHLDRWLGLLGNANSQKEYYLTDVVELARQDGVRVRAVVAPDPTETMGVNSRAQLAELERVYQRRRVAELMEQGVTFFDPSRVDIRGALDCERDVTIDVDTIFAGNVSIASGVSVGAHCILRDVTVGADVQIEPYSYIDGATIGAGARIGPYARIRPGTVLAEDVHIGNFVEVKASDIARGSKANHLAYIGDTTVGRNVNVGAGTITCNYDGAAKHRTVIEDDVFIGSDTQLVAPVTVRRGATIGAGTTVTKEVPPDQLTISRAKQISVPGWKRPVKAKSSK